MQHGPQRERGAARSMTTSEIRTETETLAGAPSDRNHSYKAKGMRPQSGQIQVIRRCERILRMFSHAGASVSPSAVAAELRLQRSTVHRYLSSLERAGLLERQIDGNYGIGSLVVQLGAAALANQMVLEAAGPYMRQLSDEAREAVVMSVWRGRSPIVARVQEFTERLVHVSVRVGSPLPLDSAQAQVLLSFLHDRTVVGRLLHREGAISEELETSMMRIRQMGIAISTRNIEGTRTIAVPVRQEDGDACATLAFVGTINAISSDPSSPMALALIDTADQLSRQLGWDGQKGKLEVHVGHLRADHNRVS
jgi:DNA-binding IclR family transcriptional regulator